MMIRTAPIGLLLTLLPAAAIAAPPAPAAPAAAVAPVLPTSQSYKVLRDGSQIGTVTMSTTPGPNGQTMVKTATDIVVKVLGITAYTYKAQSNETWMADKLQAIKTDTVDNGTPHHLVGQLAGDKLKYTYDGKPAEAPANVISMSFWSVHSMTHPTMLDAENGKQAAVSVKDMGPDNQPVGGATKPVRHFKISGDIPRDVWFDNERLARVQLKASDGSIIVTQAD